MGLLDGTEQNTFLRLHTHMGTVNALVALPDNQHALSGSRDTTIKLFNVNDGTVLHTFNHHARSVNWRGDRIGDVTSLALLPDGLRFVSGSHDRTARIAEHGLPRDPAALEAKLAAVRLTEKGSFAFAAFQSGSGGDH